MDDMFMYVGTPKEIMDNINALEDQISRLKRRIEFYKECLADTNYFPTSGTILINFTDEQTEAAKRLGINL